MSIENKRLLYNTLIGLLRAELCDAALPDATLEHLEELYEQLINLARRHDITPIIAHQLQKNHVHESDGMRYCMLAVHRHEQMSLVQNRICDLLEQEKIEYIPLKGALLCSYYPQPWMRTRSDIDILVRSKDLENAVKLMQERLGYEQLSKNYHDVALRSKNGVCIELHFNLLERQENLDRVLSNVWQYALPAEDGTCGRVLCPEFFLFHQIAHTAYHFLNGGCGMRFIADLWLMQQQLTYDKKLFLKLCDDAKLSVFYHHLQKLISYWFEGKQPDKKTLEISDFLISGSLFGTKENKIAVNQARSGGRFGFLRARLWWPYEDLKIQYPSLEGKRYLLLFYEIRRWLHILRPGKMTESLVELKMNQTIKKEKVDRLNRFMKNVGL